MSYDNKPFWQRWYDEVWNKGREEAIDEMLASDAIVHVPGAASEPIRGPAGFKLFFRKFHNAFPEPFQTSGS